MVAVGRPRNDLGTVRAYAGGHARSGRGGEDAGTRTVGPGRRRSAGAPGLGRGRVGDVRAGVVAGAGHERAGGGRARAAAAVHHQLHGPRSAVRDAGGAARRPHRPAATGQPCGLDPAGHGPRPEHRPDGQRLRLAVGQPPRRRPSRHRAGDLDVLLRMDAGLRPRPVPAAAISQRAVARTALAPGRLGGWRRHGGPHRRLRGPRLARARDHAVPEHAGHGGPDTTGCAGGAAVRGR
jgi:hypothetical protein